MSVNNWFECKVKYLKIDENGREGKVTESYILDAVSFTEAESRICKEMETMVSGAFIVTNLKKSNITEIIPSDDESDDRWYKAKIAIIDADELTGKEKRTHQYSLVAAKDINTALTNLEISMASYIVPYEIASIADTAFLDVFNYFDDENTEQDIPENLKPLSESDNQEYENE